MLIHLYNSSSTFPHYWDKTSRHVRQQHTTDHPEHWHQLHSAVCSWMPPSSTHWSGGRSAQRLRWHHHCTNLPLADRTTVTQTELASHDCSSQMWQGKILESEQKSISGIRTKTCLLKHSPANSTSPQRIGFLGRVLGPCIRGRSWGNRR